MPRKALAHVFAAVCLLVAPMAAHADDGDHADDPDGRLEGYEKPVAITKDNGTAGSYFAMALLGGLCLGVLFKNSKRSHLD